MRISDWSSDVCSSDLAASLNGWEFALQHSFWDTGFGVILNYTIVNGDATYDNTQPSSVAQFALTGLSASANAVVFYDKNGIQAREIGRASCRERVWQYV